MREQKSILIEGLKILICVLLAACGTVDALKRIPEPFNERILPTIERGAKNVKNLGHILSLEPLFSAPDIVDPYGTKFTIYNRAKRSPTEIEFLPNKYCNSQCHGTFQYDLTDIEDSRIDANLKTVIMVSGYLSGEKIQWMESIKDDWLEMEDVNVVLVTWKDSNRYRYEFAAGATTMVARQITIFLHYFAQLNGLSLLDEQFASKIHFVGHSLGAHIAGFVGQDFGGRMGHITGLDPSGPGFNGQPVGRRLDKSDAQLVDVIHTNAGEMSGYTQLMVACMTEAATLIPNNIEKMYNACPQPLDSPKGSWTSAWFGTNGSCGHLDYYPNGGHVQPGCSGETHRCDHGRSHELFANLLKLEKARRQYGGSMPRAFRAADYEHFINGASMHLHCSDLNGCSVPMDLFSPVDRIKRTLRDSHHHDVNDGDELKLYFRTREEMPFIDDHYLLSLRIRGPPVWSADECQLNMNAQMQGDTKLNIGSLRKLTMAILPENGAYLIAIPFVGPTRSHMLANVAVHEYQKVREAMPEELEIAIEVTRRSARFADSAKSKVYWMLGWGNIEARCQLNIESAEIRPMISLGQHANKRMIARYANQQRAPEGSLVLSSNGVTESTEQLVSWSFD